MRKARSESSESSEKKTDDSNANEEVEDGHDGGEDINAEEEDINATSDPVYGASPDAATKYLPRPAALAEAEIDKLKAQLGESIALRRVADVAVVRARDDLAAALQRNSDLTEENLALISKVEELERQVEAATSLTNDLTSQIDNVNSTLKRFRHDGAGPSNAGGFQVPRYNRTSDNSDSADGNNSAFREYKNGNGTAFSRHHKLVAWCHANSICLCCYGTYTAATAGQHRQHCKQQPKPRNSFPSGYTLPKTNKRT